MTNEQIVRAAEEAIHGALGVTEGECLAQITDDTGEFIREIGFKVKNEEQDGIFFIQIFDEENGTERTLKCKTRVEILEIQ